jgi:hypothetical protein
VYVKVLASVEVKLCEIHRVEAVQNVQSWNRQDAILSPIPIYTSFDDAQALEMDDGNDLNIRCTIVHPYTHQIMVMMTTWKITIKPLASEQL